ncbi:MAG: DUF3277 family protein [Deltaproteobacteria bacterium]|nr:DUF3277 family protein [Deltaproteobacteria bacterium]
MVWTYDPGQVSVSVGDFDITGFQPGTMVTVERDERMFTKQMGTQGEGTRSKSNDRSGRITIMLMQTSPSNAILSSLAALDEYGNAGLVNAQVKDASGKSIYQAETAWIEGYPNAEYANEAGPREWVIVSDKITMFEGGNA